jgi:putative oxygen-independent coproporphyrinogen III oxidase
MDDGQWTIHGPPWRNPRAAYLHIPFCQHHCGYCDFAVASGQDHQIDLYLEALECELATLGQPAPVKTIFLGGGTPTYLSPKQLERLLRSIHKWLPLEAGGEFSIESTPESITPEKIALLAARGVNRVSIGVQSFHPYLLSALDRIHQPEHVGPAVLAARSKGMAVSLDLIFGVPGQSLFMWMNDLELALGYKPDHLSTYGLTYEKGTPLWKDRERGQVKALDEEAELLMYESAMDVLGEAGFEHYEISNFARPGFRCRHNEVYWANHAYYGFGMGAARYVNGRREVNTRSLPDYLKRTLSGESAIFQSEELGVEDRARETAVVQIRRSDGIERESFRLQTSFDLVTLLGQKIRNSVALGLLEDDGEAVRLTRRGKCVADALAADWL